MHTDVLDRPSARARAVAGAAAVVWVLAMVGYASWLGLVVLGGDLVWCERGDSDFGTLSWSRLPPGPVCTWTSSGVDSVGPGVGYTLVDVALAAGLLVVVFAAGVAWRRGRQRS